MVLRPTSPEFNIVAVSDAYLRATMTDRTYIIGKRLFEIFPDNPDDPNADGVKNLKESLERVLKDRVPDAMATQKYDVRRPEQQGGEYEQRYWNAVNIPVFQKNGEIAHILHFVEDATEFIQLKERGIEQDKLTKHLQIRSQFLESETYLKARQIHHANERLVASNKILEETNRRLKLAEKSKDEFLATVSHELRTPLTLIFAPVESLLTDLEMNKDHASHQQLVTIRNNALRLLQMINGLLDFSKIQSGRIEVIREPLDVLKLTQSILDDFESTMTCKNLKSSIESKLQSPIIEMDRYLYERILLNLISNATKFTPEGGKITVILNSDSENITVSVRDTGKGISETDQAKLFERFKQLDSSSTRRYEGTGLGLSLVKEFTGLLEGTVKVRSGFDNGEGTEFTVTLKAPPSQAKPIPIHRNAKRLVPLTKLESQTIKDLKTDDKALKVLIAEDNAELGPYLQSLIEKVGEVILVDDGQKALEAVSAWSPDLILSDVMMPKLDGMALCKIVKANPRTSHIPVILLTALTHQEALLKGWEMGADDYLFKPFHPIELMTRVRSLLNLVKLRKQRDSEKLRRQDLEEFAFIASHDLREPLRMIKLYSQLLLEKTPEKSDAEKQEYLETIAVGADRVRTLITDLTTYSLSRQKCLFLEDVDTNQAVQEALANLAVDLKASGTQVQVHSLPLIHFNRVKLVQVFQNLIQNASKFRKDGNSHIEIDAHQVGKEWVFEVKDDGIGFEKKYAEDIFLIFRRLHDRSKYSGSGIGLAVCKAIVQEAGGRIWAESEPDSGSTFYFSLAAKNSNPERSQNHATQAL